MAKLNLRKHAGKSAGKIVEFILLHFADGVMKLDKDSYIKLIKDKKIGGVARKLKILATADDRHIDMAKVTLTGDKVVFHDFLALIKTAKGWQIVGNTARVVPVK